MRNSLKRKIWLAGASGAVALAMTAAADAATTTSTFTAQIVIQANCVINSTNTLDFGTSGVITANIDAQADISVQCTNTTAYDVGLDAGNGASGTIATRTMENGAAAVNYQMYSDAGRTTNWGNTVGTDTVSGVGTGAAVTHTVYGRVPPQATPAPGTYTDTVTVTVTF